MKKFKVLLVDLDREKRSGELLQDALATNAGLLEVKAVGEVEMSRASKRLASAVFSFSPDLVFFIFGALAQAAIGELVPLCRAGKTARPVIAVVNTGDPKDVAAALFHGVNDFLIPPSTPIKGSKSKLAGVA